MSASYLDILGRLVGFASVSRSSNLELIDWIRAYLRGHGVSSRLTFNTERTKANLFATLGPSTDGGIVLSGHSDVVPVDGQQWSSDPFSTSVHDGRVYGRGTCDMKGFIAVALGLVPEVLASPGKYPIHLAFSFDEEVGCLGVRGLLADLDSLEIHPRGCIVGEPTGMNIVTAHKGAGMYACQVTGFEVHSSLAPKGVNAIHYAAKVIVRLGEIADRLCRSERRHAGFDIPYSTIQVNQINGGTVGNTVAGGCRFTIDIRHLPWTNREDLIAETRAYIETDIIPAMRRVAPASSIALSEIADIPAFSIDQDHPIVREISRHRNAAGPCGCVAFATEAGLFQNSGIPTVVCGPGSIDQAHQADEFVSLHQLDDCAEMLRRIALGPDRAVYV